MLKKCIKADTTFRGAPFAPSAGARRGYRPLARLAAVCLGATIAAGATSIPAPIEAAGPQPRAARTLPSNAEFWDAVARDDTRTVQTLLLRGIDTNVEHPEFGPAIVVAARERSWNTVRELAQIAGTRVDAPNARGETATMLAALQGNLETVRLLVGKGAQVNRPGWTPLHYAAVSGNADLLRFLLDENAYIDAQSPNQTTPMMMAARHGHADAVRLLVEAGADPTPKNDTGLDAAAYLLQQGKPDEASWLRERAADYARRYGTLEQPRSAESIADERRRAQRLEKPRLPGARD